jgi:PAS domain S-box-containing protein
MSRQLRNIDHFALMGLLAAIYFFAGKLGLAHAFLHPSASAVWPPTGIALAALLLWGYRLWPGVLLGAFLLNLTIAGNLATSAGIAVGNTAEALLGAWLVSRFANGVKAFDHAGSIFRFVVGAALLSTAVSATMGVSSLCVAGFAPWDHFLPIWLTWWLGDMTSSLVLTPLIIVWSAKPVPSLKPQQIWEALGVLLLALVVAQIVFGEWSYSDNKYRLSFLCIPPILLAAYRLGRHGAVTAVFLVSAAAIWGTLRGFGPFASAEPNESLVFLQAFMGTTALTAIVLAAVTAERRESEQALGESSGRLQAIVDTAVDGIITIDEQGLVTSFNPGAQRIFGYSSAELIGVNVKQLMPEPYHRDHDSYLARYLRTGERKIIGIGREVQGLRKNGAIFPLELTVSETQLGDRRIFTGMVRDITARVEALNHLAAEHAVTRALAESRTLAEASVRILQTICETLHWEFGALWTKYPAEGVLRCIASWHPPAKAFPEFTAICRDSAFSRGRGLPGRIWLSHKPAWICDVTRDDNFPRAPFAVRDNLHSAFGFPIRLGAQFSGVVEFFSHEIRQPDEALLKMVEAIGSEIGQFIERLRTEEELRRLNRELEQRVAERTASLERTHAELMSDIEQRLRLEEQLRQGERLSILGLATAKVAHEIGNPLNGIATTSQLLERHFDANPSIYGTHIREIVAGLKNEIDRLKSLLEEIRVYSSPNLQRLELEPASLTLLIAEVVSREQKNYLEQGIQIEQDLAADMPMIAIDRKKMIQVLLNLCKNAAEAMPQGGTLRLRSYCGDSKIFLEVADTGVGIPSELNIFKPLTTSKSNGLGIGLAVVEQIISAHQGSIDYTSELGNGAIFRITLPLDRIEANPSARI